MVWYNNFSKYQILMQIFWTYALLVVMVGFSINKEELGKGQNINIYTKPKRILVSSKALEQNYREQKNVYATKAIKKVYNIENKDKIFGDMQEFSVKINRTYMTNQTQINELRSMDIWDKIQIRTKFDYPNLTNQINFTQLRQKLANSISYELIQFPYDEKLNKTQPKINMTDFYKSINYKGLQRSIYGSRQKNLDYEFKHSIKIAMNPQDPQLKLQEYYYYDKKHHISQIKNEIPLCIYGAGYKIFSKNRHIEFFQSMQRQNYTNFHIVYVDDNSPQEEVAGLLKYLQEGNLTAKNKIKIIHNLQRLGPLANLYFWVNKFCNTQDIVVHVDTDDSLLGSQALQVINANYQNPQIWFMYSRYLLDEGNSSYKFGFSKPIRTTTEKYRQKFQFWDVSALRSFRKKLFEKIPLDAALQYHFDQKTGVAKPRFYEFAYDAFEIFALLQMAGDQRLKYISDFLYIYSGSGSNDKSKKCYSKHQKVDDFKFRIKTPFNLLKTIKDSPSYKQNFKENQYTAQVFRKLIMYNYRKCLRKQAFIK